MDRYYPVALTVPPNTAVGTPVEQLVVLENNELVDVELQVPSGHAGFTGVRVLSSHQQILPWGNNSWITANDYVRVFDWNEEIGANAISVQGYNTDKIAHTFYLRFHVVNISVAPEGVGSTPLGGSGGIVGTGGGGGTITLPEPPTIPPITLPEPPLIPPISPISGPGGTAPAPGNIREQKLLLLMG